MKDLAGRVAVITGAAGGIGLALAREFAARGMRLVLADVEAGPLDAALASLRAGGADAIRATVDVRSEAQVNALADAAYARYGAVHLVCNNAGVLSPAIRTHAWDASLDDWRWIMDVNFVGVLNGVRAFVPRMLAGGDEGHVVNTASVAGLLTGANPYHVSKHAVSCLTEGLYKDLRAMDARVSASVLCPGIVRTAILDGERNRPDEYGPVSGDSRQTEEQRQWTARFRQALAAGLDPAEVAVATAEAVVADRYWVVPAQAPLLEMIRVRMHDVLEGRNPTLPPSP
jgi:NAD(P)-dependent dehydrogenase (short-subunit alcohol dehydrogenase family)